MRLSSTRLLFAALLFAPLAAFAAKPAVPTVTVGAALKQLRFDVEPVTGATSYELWFLPNGAASWVNYMTTIDADPLFKVTVSGHLLDWFNARYKVSACNAEGCSTTAKIAVTQHMKDTVGYVKPRAASLEPFEFGKSPALSADGKTLAVLVGETIGPRKRSAAVYVYQKTDTGWQRTARLVPSLIEANTGEYVDHQYYTVQRQLAISADGTSILLGLPREFPLTPNHFETGAAYFFRKSGTTWALEQKVATGSHGFGAVVDLDAHGQTAAIFQSQNETGYLIVNIYRRSASGWALLKQLPEDARSYEIANFDLSGDGSTLAAHNYDGRINIYTGADFSQRRTLISISSPSRNPKGGIATNYDGSVVAFSTASGKPSAGQTWQSHIMAFRRGPSGWVAEPPFTYLAKQPNLQTGYSNEFASYLAVSTDGRFIVAGDPKNRYVGTGALHTPIATGTAETGAVFVFERYPTSWQLRSLIKPNTSTADTRFGGGLALGDNQRILAVGAMHEDSAARDIDGDQTNTAAPDSGALWLY
jgi:trimeric autotransporter adhesin